jgi:regulator of replication initiation timing
MADLKQLRKDAKDAEAEAQRLMREKEKLRKQIAKATETAAAKQSLLCDAEAAHALADREDLSDEEKAAKAQNLGLKLP